MHSSPARPEAYRSWLVGELVLVGLLGAATAYLALSSSLGGYALPQARLALDTAVAVCATIVAILASIRFLVEGRVLDVLLGCGFLSAGLGTLAFGVGPVLGGGTADARRVMGRGRRSALAAALVAAAPFVHRRVGSRPQISLSRRDQRDRSGRDGRGRDDVRPRHAIEPGVGHSLPADARVRRARRCSAFSRCVGFGLRFRARARPRQLADARLDADAVRRLHSCCRPCSRAATCCRATSSVCSPTPCCSSESGGRSARRNSGGPSRRARTVAREIHDGLAQYLFALSTHVSMLESGPRSVSCCLA